MRPLSINLSPGSTRATHPTIPPTLKSLEMADWNKLYAEEKPPPFGHEMLQYYLVDPEGLHLNNGSCGAAPLPVYRAAYELSLRIESAPDPFHRLELPPMLRGVRERLANLIGANTDEVVLVTNASMGMNTVLRNFDWEEGDILFVFTTTYNSVSRAAQSIADSPAHPTLKTITLNFPTTHKEIISLFTSALRDNPAKPNRGRVAIIDSLVSNPGVHLPWEEMVKICKDEGVWSVVDAAHSLGQEVGLDLTRSAPDFWVSNCHKWLSGKRSCSVLYIPKRNQHIVKFSIPTSPFYISPSIRKSTNLVEQFDWNGLIDWTPYLTVDDALNFRHWLGGEEKINAYCHDLAMRGGQHLAEILGTETIDESENGNQTLNMTNVRLPIPASAALAPNLWETIQRKCFVDHKAFVFSFYHNGSWWTRCCAQIWNELSDFEKTGKILLQIIKEITEESDIERVGIPEPT